MVILAFVLFSCDLMVQSLLPRYTNVGQQNHSKTVGFSEAKEVLPKWTSGHILPPLTCPPLQTKVSQVEIEAGDCEGRLPLLFQDGRLSVVSGQLR